MRRWCCNELSVTVACSCIGKKAERETVIKKEEKRQSYIRVKTNGSLSTLRWLNVKANLFGFVLAHDNGSENTCLRF